MVREGDPPEVGFDFVRANHADHAVSTMCRVLGLSTSGYYAWRSRPPSARARKDRVLRDRIREIHQDSRGTYGMPRIHAQLQREGVRVARKRVARLMREQGLQGASRRRFVVTTRRGKERPAPDLVDRDFSADGRDQLWVADVTYVPTGKGFLYVAVVVDAWSRRVVGWSMRTHLKTQLVLEALEMAVQQRRPTDVVHHSDQGCQYTSVAFGARCAVHGVRPSMGSVGDAYDNAMCESFFATLECELLDQHVFADPNHARTYVFEFIEGWYNSRRLHSALGYVSPLEFEHRHAEGHPQAAA